MNRGRYNFRNHQYGGRGRGDFQDQYQNFQPEFGYQNQPRGNFRGGSDRRNKPVNSRKGPGANVFLPKGTEKPSVGPPPPQHLSKVESAEKNDPLYREAVFVEASQDLRPEPNSPEYFVGCEGFTELTTQVYDNLKSTCSGFAKRVPRAAFAYYSAVVVWQRMLKLHMKNGFRTSFEEQDFIRIIDDLGLEVPSPLASFMNSMGNTSMPSGREVMFRIVDRTYVQSEEELVGWFGQVGADNHYLYRNYPCLAVFARNIMQCLRATDAPAQERGPLIDWDLPLDIQPEQANHGLPTPNMLGYVSAEIYHQEQVRFLSGAQFRTNHYPASDSEEMPVFTGLLRAIQSEINVTTIFKHEPLNSLIMGSQSQNLVVEVPLERRQPAVYGRGIPYCLSKLTSVVAYLGAGLKFRTRHLDIRRRAHATMPSCVYSFNQFEEVPVQWAVTNNQLRTFEDPVYNMHEFAGVEFLVRARVEKLVESERVLKS